MPKLARLGDDGKRTVDVHMDSNGRYFFDVDATESIEDTPDLIVDNDLTATIILETVEKDLTIKAGSYHFDSSIGDFGAYRIYLD
ncbi:hypothetical protein [Chryseobacterium sp.]|uniref:hypothetical protein n=1 Tax=Chryseobacterium sp. TaxID=1871047 RepID=UPI00289F137F|nr:hypothetical protein [Chryseobacterium sp.]